MNSSNTTWRDVPVPQMLARRPRDRRGFVIPWAVMVDEHSTPHFTVMDEIRRIHVLERDLCPLCGFKLFRYRAFVGGPRSAFDPNGAYTDPPMHLDCAQYALQVCPYLAAPHYASRIDDKTIPEDQRSEWLVLEMPGTIDERPDEFVMVVAVGSDYMREHGIVRPVKPYVRIERWRHGKQIGAVT